nr:ImmA/IrrE family metallo-endopeptidase [uncultured Agathobaculum sp.]
MSYKDYQNARDAAWKILLDCGIDRLPVDLNTIRNQLGVHIASYKDAKALIRKRNLSVLTAQTDGFTFYARAEPVILYSEACSPERIRFTIAHELGHIVLGHVVPGSITTANREPSLGDSPQETAANQFAARLLAPACVLWGLDLHTADEIAVACRISKKAAQFRSERMKTLYARNKFLSSPLERKLYQRFVPFMEEVCCRGVHPDESLQSD